MKQEKVETPVGEGAPAPETPQEIADTLAEALRSTSEEEGVDFGIAIKKKRGRKSEEEETKKKDDVPEWTPDGIGTVVASTHNLIFAAYDLPELEDKEHKEVATQSARFLNAIWPTGAAFEPHAAFALTEVSVILPRLAAYQLRKKNEDEVRRQREASEKGLTLVGDGKEPSAQ